MITRQNPVWRPEFINDFRLFCRHLVVRTTVQSPSGNLKLLFENTQSSQIDLGDLDDLIGITKNHLNRLKDHTTLITNGKAPVTLSRIINFLELCTGKRDIPSVEEQREDSFIFKLASTAKFVQGTQELSETALQLLDEATDYRKNGTALRLPTLNNNLELVPETSRILKIPAHSGQINRAGFCPTGRIVATCSTSKDIILWPLSNLVNSRSISGHEDQILGCEYSKNGKYLATASRDGLAIVRFTKNDRIARKLDGHSGWVTDVAFCDSRDVVATSSDDNSVRIWEINSKDPPIVLSQHKNWVRSVAFSPCGNFLVSSSADNTAIVWDWQTRKVQSRCVGHKDSVYEAMFINAGTEVVTVSLDKTVRFWDTLTGQEIPLENHDAHVGSVTSISVSDEGSIMATGSVDGSATIWDTLSRRPIKRVMHSERSINTVRISPDGRFLLTGTEDRGVKFTGLEAQGEVSLWRIR